VSKRVGEHAIEDLIVGQSDAICRLRARVAQLAPLGLPVLIEGPTGSGKELVAEALHLASGRSGRFVALNVCALSETMFEDALFGHARGAFTGALSDRDGYFAEADGGTLFLDEIGGLPLASQAKLLRVLETREFRPLGARRDRRSDCRVVAATNDDLAAHVRAGRMRADLYHRLRGALVRVPSLSERTGDVPLLAQHFASRTGHDAGAGSALLSGALPALARHPWPGNVRQLRYVVEYLVALAPGGPDGGALVSEVLDQLANDGPGASTAGEQTEERRALHTLLDRHGWDVLSAAREWGTSRASMYRRMERLGVRRPPSADRRRRVTAPPEALSAASYLENSQDVSRPL